jgi:acyl carrier protein
MTPAKSEATSANDQVVSDKIMSMVRSKTNIPVTPESTLDNAGLDSLSMAEFVFEIEAEFQIRANDALLEVQSFREVIEYVKLEIANKKSVSLDNPKK